LSPAFDLNPFPDKLAESKTWLSEDTGPITSIGQLLHEASRFELTPEAARVIVSEVGSAVARWQTVAITPAVGLTPRECVSFEAAFQGRHAL